MHLVRLAWSLSSLLQLTQGWYIPTIVQPTTPITTVAPVTTGLPDYYGDPIVGKPWKYKTCNTPQPPGKARRDLGTAHHVRMVGPPAPQVRPTRKPLDEPESDSDEHWAAFMLRLARAGQELDINPWANKDWSTVYKGVTIPIGATGVWFPYKSSPPTFQMSGLGGCTAIIAISTMGVYGGHLWEGAEGLNGPSAFGKRFKDENGDPASGQRSPAEFQQVAVDIWGQETPRRLVRERPLWKSIQDLAVDTVYGDAFKTGQGLEVFTLTIATTAAKTDMLYPDEIGQLSAEFAKLLPEANRQIRLYSNEEVLPPDMEGLIMIQYAPYDHDGGQDGRTPQARVRVFYEMNRRAVIDKSWGQPEGEMNQESGEDSG